MGGVARGLVVVVVCRAVDHRCRNRRVTQTHFSGTSSLVAHCTLDLGEFNDYPKSVEVAPVTLLRHYSSLIDTAHHCSVRCLLCSGVADGIATSILVC